MKIALADYLLGSGVLKEDLRRQVENLVETDLHALTNDNIKKAFWVNIYNGLTNYFIIRHQLKKSVWEVPNFFSVLKVNIGGIDFSLDDIEHGILRKNGTRKKDKPLQFKEGDERLKLMVNKFDPRIHFALNCGSVSCPPIAFYSTENIDRELSLAEESFAEQEFIISHQEKEIRCSEIFIWYQGDFPESYLNSQRVRGYNVKPIPYRWTIH